MKALLVDTEGLYPQTKKSDPSLHNLAMGILLQAFRDIVQPKRPANKEWAIWRHDAIEWFFSDETHPGSFSWVCEVLTFNIKELRDWLRTYQCSSHYKRREMTKELIRFQLKR